MAENAVMRVGIFGKLDLTAFTAVMHPEGSASYIRSFLMMSVLIFLDLGFRKDPAGLPERLRQGLRDDQVLRRGAVILMLDSGDDGLDRGAWKPCHDTR